MERLLCGGIPLTATGNKELDSLVPDDTNPCLHLDCNFMRPCTRTILAKPQIPQAQKPTDNACYVRILSLETLRYTAVTN